MSHRTSAYSQKGVAPSQVIKTYLFDDANSDMAVDGSGTPVIFKYTVPANSVLFLERFILYMEGSTALDSIKFGNLTALTNGVDLSAGGTILQNWKDNIDIATTMFDVPGRANFGKETNTLTGRWTLSKETGGFPLAVEAGGTVDVTVNDDLSTLVAMHLKIGGMLCNLNY